MRVHEIGDLSLLNGRPTVTTKFEYGSVRFVKSAEHSAASEMTTMTAGDWLEDFERVTRATLSAQADAMDDLEASLEPMEREPKKYDLSVREVRRRRAMLEALREQCTEQDPLLPETAVDAKLIDDDSYQQDHSAIQIGLLDDLHVDTSYRRQNDGLFYVATAIVAILLVAFFLYFFYGPFHHSAPPKTTSSPQITKHQ